MTGFYSIDDIVPRLPEDSSHWLAPSAFVIGDVVLGRNVGVWYYTVLRGDIERIIVGDNTNLQESSVLHTDRGYPLTVGRDCTIGHRALLHGCTIGDNTLIGMSATIMNGAKIGKNCMIGAGALVTEGKEIPDGSLVIGAPGKIIRTLSENEITRISASAKRYIEAMNQARRAKKVEL